MIENNEAQCWACDGDGFIPSEAYLDWQKIISDVPELIMCSACNGKGRLAYIDGEEERFYLLTERWEEETGMLSSIQKKIEHPCYQAIKKMNKKFVIIHLLKMSAHSTNHLSLIMLSELVPKRHNPIPKEMRGKIHDMTMKWIEWGIKHKFIEEKYKKTRERTVVCEEEDVSHDKQKLTII